MISIALYGGSFDPVHEGHVQSARELKQRLELDELRLLPCRNPPHREALGASAEQRLAMLELALAPYPQLQLDDRELRREGLSYTVDTLAELRTELGTEISLSWVMGADAFAGLERWHRWTELLSLANIVVMARPGAILPDTGPVAQLQLAAQAASAQEIRQRTAGAIWFETLEPYPVSATNIRSALASRAPERVQGMLCPDVLDYIEKQGLYR